MEADSVDQVMRFGPEAPPILHLLASVLLFLHIAGASVALIAGAAALLTRKGDRLHRVAGTTFVISMVIMLTVAAGTSGFLPDPEPGQVYGGLFVIYLVLTAWMAVKRPEGQVGRFELWACVIAVALGLAGVVGALLGDTPAWAFVAIVAFAVLGDIRVLARRGVSGPSRITRHLWRMCAAMFVATGSFFFGQADEIPAAFRGQYLMIPALAPFAFMIFYAIRVRIGTAFKSPTIASIEPTLAPGEA